MAIKINATSTQEVGGFPAANCVAQLVNMRIIPELYPVKDENNKPTGKYERKFRARYEIYVQTSADRFIHKARPCYVVSSSVYVDPLNDVFEQCYNHAVANNALFNDISRVELFPEYKEVVEEEPAVTEPATEESEAEVAEEPAFTEEQEVAEESESE